MAKESERLFKLAKTKPILEKTTGRYKRRGTNQVYKTAICSGACHSVSHVLGIVYLITKNKTKELLELLELRDFFKNKFKINNNYYQEFVSLD